MSNQQSNRQIGYLAPDMVVRGSVRGQGDLECAGLIEGPVDLHGVLAVSGRVVGPIRGQRVDVAGVTQGNVTGAEVRIAAGGRIIGDVRAARIGLEDGGVLDGTVEMDVQLPESLFGETS